LTLILILLAIHPPIRNLRVEPAVEKRTSRGTAVTKVTYISLG
jgi:hypothetical protein